MIENCEMAFVGLYLSYIILILLLIIYFKLIYKCKRGVELLVEVKNGKSVQSKIVLPQAPGPIPWPILGNLALLGQYDVPFEGFTALAKIYGEVYSLTLGSVRCVIVNNLEIIKEVLNQNGKYFGGRPNFEVRFLLRNLFIILLLIFYYFFGRDFIEFSAAIEITVSFILFF